MKRWLFILLLCTALLDCSKKSNPAPVATVEYRYEGLPSLPLYGYYVNAKGMTVDTGFVGTSFSKTMRVTKAGGFTSAELSLGIDNSSFSGSGTVYIIVNGNTVLQQYVDFAWPKSGFDCKAPVFGAN